MAQRAPRHGRAAVALLLFTWASAGVALALAADARYAAPTWNAASDAAGWLFTMSLAAAFGVVVLYRGRGGAQAWLLLCGGCAGAAAVLADHLAGRLAYVDHAPAVAVAVPAHLATIGLLAPWALLGIVLPLYFPTGRLVSSRWRSVQWLALGSALAVLLAESLAAGPIFERDGQSAENPFAAAVVQPLVAVLELGYFGLFGGMFLAAASLVVRLRRARGLERQQLLWVTYFVVLAIVIGLAHANLMTALGADAVLVRLLGVVAAIANLGVPASIAMAMLRYRLYDVDRVVNRTVVYVVLTAVLVAVYATAVAAIGAVLRATTGGESQVAVAASTLAVAALVQPLRRRIQDFVDKRFYRQRYDARRTLERFTDQLREELDLEQLVAELTAVVARTMQPARVADWLRPQQRVGG